MHYQRIIGERVPKPFDLPKIPRIAPGVIEAATEAARDQARDELGADYSFVDVGAAATLDGLHEDLDGYERLDAMIDKCIKRLLFVRGLKSMTPPSRSDPSKRVKGNSETTKT